jgi:hypothetical protein
MSSEERNRWEKWQESGVRRVFWGRGSLVQDEQYGRIDEFFSDWNGECLNGAYARDPAPFVIG